MNSVIVVGAGASGMMAAISAAAGGADVTLLEGGEKPGKKLLMTGNGRCNLTNRNVSVKERYFGSSAEWIGGILKQFPPEDTLRFFLEIGLPTVSKDGYVYPATNQASSVLSVLLAELKRLSVKMKCSEKVTGICKENGLFKIRTASWEYQAEACILACGSMAAPFTGSDGSGYALAKEMGHRLIAPMEALVPLKIKETWIRALSGVRMQAKLSLFCFPPKAQPTAGKKTADVYREAGELQWTDYGISGILVFQVSRHAVRTLREGGSAKVCLDLFPLMEKEELIPYLKAHKRPAFVSDLLTGILPGKAAAPILRQAGILPSLKTDCLKETDYERIACAVKELALTVSGCQSFDRAQVCSGGVDTAQINGKSLESLLVPGLYFSGELLDVDGVCGGYNLQWAWSSGAVAGRSSARKNDR